MEYRRRCNVCGKIYCYSDKDLSENKSNSAMAALSAIGGIASIFGGTRLDTYALNNQTDRYSSKVVDYNKCPSCNSSNTSLMTDAEWIEMQQKETATVQAQVIQTKKIDINSNATSESLLKRTKMFLEEADWDSASAYCEQILDIDPECAMAYVYKLMIELEVTEQDKLALLSKPFSEEKLYQKAVRFADESLKAILEGYNFTIIERNNERTYSDALNEYNAAKTEQDCKALIPKFKALGNYKDSLHMVSQCEEKAIICKYSHATQLQQKAKTEKEYLEAKAEFDSISSYHDAGTLASACKDKAEEARKNAIYDGAVSCAGSSTIVTVEDAVKEFEKIPGWRDADQKKAEALNRIEMLKKTEKRAANKKKTIITLSTVVVVACIAVIVVLNNKHKAELYQTAYNYYQEGMFIEAAEVFDELGNYKDATEQAKKSHYSAGVNLVSSNPNLACDQFELAGEYEDASLNHELLKISSEFSNWNDGEEHSLESIQELSVYSNCVAYAVFMDTPIGQQLIMLQGNWVAKPTYYNTDNYYEYRISGGSWERTKGGPADNELTYVNGTLYLYYFETNYYNSIEANSTNSAIEYYYDSEYYDAPKKTIWSKK